MLFSLPEAKDQRIQELRSALASVMAERTSLQQQLHAAGAGQPAGSCSYGQMQQQLEEARETVLEEQRRLLHSQKQFADTQVGWEEGPMG